MPTKVSRFCERLIEAGWLLSIGLVPLLFNQYSEIPGKTFEGNKAFLLRSLVLIMLAAWFIKLLESGNIKKTIKQSFAKTPLLLPALLLGGLYLISSLLSPYRWTSLAGYYLRDEGFYTVASYFIIFLLMLQGLKRQRQIDLLVTVAILTGFIISLYGIFQHFSLDPLRTASKERITSTMGGPIFAAGFLIMVIPLTLYRLINGLKSRRDGMGIKPQTFLAIVYGIMLLAQLLCFYFTKSRGPLIGLLVGLFIFGLLISAHRRIKWLFASILIVVLLTGSFVVMLNIHNSPLSSLRPRLGRFGENILESETVKSRFIIWQGTSSVLCSNPLRLFTGYGLESLYFLYYLHCPAEIDRYERAGVIPDHSHNDTFDRLITTGIVGYGLYLMILLLAVYLVFRQSGIIRDRRQRSVFIWIVLIAGLLGLGSSGIIGEGLTFIGIGIPAGILLGIGVYLIYQFALSQRQDSSVAPLPQNDRGGRNPNSELRTPNYELLSIALISGILAHFVEINFGGMGLTSTRLYFWAYVALIGIITAGGATARTGPNRDGITNQARTEEEPRRTNLGPILIYAIIGGLVLSIFCFNILTRKMVLEGGTPLTQFIILAGIIVLFYGLLIKDASFPLTTQRYFGYYLLYLILSLCWGGLFIIIQTSLLTGQGIIGLALTNLLYIWVGVNLIVLAFFIPGEPRHKVSGLMRGFSQGLVYLILVLITLGIIYFTNLREAHADIYARAGSKAYKNKQWERSIELYNKSVALSSSKEYYYDKLSNIYLSKGDFAASEKTLREAFEITPHRLSYLKSLANIYLRWAEKLPEPERINKLEQSIKCYHQLIEKYRSVSRNDRAAQLQTRLVWPHKELWGIYSSLNRHTDCIRIAKRLIALEPDQWKHQYNLARAYQAQNNKSEALRYARKALEMGPPEANKIVEKLIKEIEGTR